MSMISSTVRDAADAGAITAFCCSVVFLLGYTIMAPWWRYAVGRAVASLDAAIVVTLAPDTLHLWFGLNVSNAFFAWYEVASLFVVALTTLWRLFTIHRVQAAPVPVPPKESE